MKRDQQIRWITIAVMLLLIAQIVVGILSLRPEEKPIQNWVCVQTVCDRFMTQQEMVDNFCRLDTDGTAICDVTLNGNQVQSVPMAQINFSNVAACAQERCVAESIVREANYTID